MPRNAADFLSIYQQGFVRVAACRPVCRIADPAFNLEQTLRLAREGDEAGIALMVFPELGLEVFGQVVAVHGVQLWFHWDNPCDLPGRRH